MIQIPIAKRKINVLIPDGESFFTLAVLNCLSEYKNIDVHIVYSSKEVNGVKYSNKIKSFTFFSKTKNEIDFIDFLKQEIQKRKINILMPLHYYSIRLISKYRNEFGSLNINSLLPNVEILDKINNKWELSKYLTKNKIAAPKTIHDFEDINNLSYPILYKPSEGTAGGLGIKLIKCKNDLNIDIKSSKEYVLQEYLKGYDIDFNVLCKDGKILAYSIQKGIMASTKPFAPPAAVEFLFDEKLFNMMVALFKSLNWTGLANVDLLFDEIENDYKIIEINPRFWGSIDSSCSVGVNFPYLYCLTSMGVQYEIPEYRFEGYAKNRVLIKILKSKFSFSKNKMELPKNLTIRYDLLDPLPKIIKYFYKIYHWK